MASVPVGAAAAGVGDGAVAAPGNDADEDADADALADDFQAHLIARDADGRFLSQTRRRRRPKYPDFPIIEAVNDEAAPGADAAGGEGGTAPQYRAAIPDVADPRTCARLERRRLAALHADHCARSRNDATPRGLRTVRGSPRARALRGRGRLLGLSEVRCQGSDGGERGLGHYRSKQLFSGAH